MTRPKYRYVRAGAAVVQADGIRVAECAALLEQDCPAGGNVFWYIYSCVKLMEGGAQGREIYERNRDAVSATSDSRPAGHRIPAFYLYELNIPLPLFETPQDEARFLAARGLLTTSERRKLPKDWFKPSKPILEVIR